MGHERGATALYGAVDAIFLPIIAMMGVARSIRGTMTVWTDTILRRITSWSKIPDEMTFGQILRTFKQSHTNAMETLNHRLRSRIWKDALRRGKVPKFERSN